MWLAHRNDNSSSSFLKLHYLLCCNECRIYASVEFRSQKTAKNSETSCNSIHVNTLFTENININEV